MSKLQFGSLLVVLLAIVALLAVPRLSSPSYDYKIVTVPDLMFEGGMKIIGDNGWDLVFARRAIDEHKDPAYEMIFKRAK